MCFILVFQIEKKFVNCIFYFPNKCNPNYHLNFNDWNSKARLDGLVCRDDTDCMWIDNRLGCDDRGFKRNEIKVVYNVLSQNTYLFDQK